MVTNVQRAVDRSSAKFVNIFARACARLVLFILFVQARVGPDFFFISTPVDFETFDPDAPCNFATMIFPSSLVYLCHS